MSVLLQIDFPFPGPWGDDLASQYSGLALSIADEPGLLWKIWTESPERGEAGGVYLFSDAQSAETYREMHVRRLEAAGIHDIRWQMSAINIALTQLDRGPLPAPALDPEPEPAPEADDAPPAGEPPPQD